MIVPEDGHHLTSGEYGSLTAFSLTLTLYSYPITTYDRHPQQGRHDSQYFLCIKPENKPLDASVIFPAFMYPNPIAGTSTDFTVQPDSYV